MSGGREPGGNLYLRCSRERPLFFLGVGSRPRDGTLSLAGEGNPSIQRGDPLWGGVKKVTRLIQWRELILPDPVSPQFRRLQGGSLELTACSTPWPPPGGAFNFLHFRRCCRGVKASSWSLCSLVGTSYPQPHREGHLTERPSGGQPEVTGRQD